MPPTPKLIVKLTNLRVNNGQDASKNSNYFIVWITMPVKLINNIYKIN